jgi:hypothetical protein
MMLRFSLRRYFDRHPAVPLGVACLAMIYGVALSVQRIMHARGTVHADWALTVALGLAWSLALIGVVVGWFWRAPRRPHVAATGFGLLLGLAAVFLAGVVYTRPAVMPAVGAPATVTTAFQLAAITFMIPLYCGLAALLAWVYTRVANNRKNLAARKKVSVREAAVPAGRGGDLLTALIGPSADGWSVTWVRVGGTPRPLSATTLTAAAEQAAAAAVRRWQSRPPCATAELTLSIYPTRGKRGPTLEVSGAPGNFTATNPESGITVHGATLEDLLAAAHRVIEPPAGGFILHWTRLITALPLINTEHPPAAEAEDPGRVQS